MSNALPTDINYLKWSQLESQLKPEEPRVEPVVTLAADTTPEHILVEISCRYQVVDWKR